MYRGRFGVWRRAEIAIGRGLKAMVVFCLLGWVVGWAAESVIHEHVHKEAQKAISELEAEQQVESAEPTNGQQVESQTRT